MLLKLEITSYKLPETVRTKHLLSGYCISIHFLISKK